MLLLGVGACGADQGETAVESLDEAGEAQVELVTGEPFEATGLVHEVIGPRGFLLFDTLVVSPAALRLEEEFRVRVVGEVQSASELEPELRDALGDEVREAVADEDLLVVASTVEVVDETTR